MDTVLLLETIAEGTDTSIGALNSLSLIVWVILMIGIVAYSVRYCHKGR